MALALVGVTPKAIQISFFICSTYTPTLQVSFWYLIPNKTIAQKLFFYCGQFKPWPWSEWPPNTIEFKPPSPHVPYIHQVSYWYLQNFIPNWSYCWETIFLMLSVVTLTLVGVTPITIPNSYLIWSTTYTQNFILISPSQLKLSFRNQILPLAHQPICPMTHLIPRTKQNTSTLINSS